MDEGCPSCAALRLLLQPTNVTTTTPAAVEYVDPRPVVVRVSPVTWTCANGHPVGD